MGSLGFLMPNIVRGGVFIVSDNLIFVSQIEYNRTKRKENILDHFINQQWSNQYVRYD